jgi:chorismate synthase
MLTGILDGAPAGLALDQRAMAHQLARRRQGYGRSPRQLLEQDDLEIVGGVRFGTTTGAPIAMLLKNAEAARWAEVLSVWPPHADMPAVAKKTVPRPGHADLAGMIKYDLDDVRDVLERASARETAMRVALSTVARALLSACGIAVGSDVIAIADVADGGAGEGGIIADVDDVEAACLRADASPVRCLDDVLGARMVARIDDAKRSGDTLGGRFVVRASGLPVGLGSHTQWDRRLSARLSMAVSSIQAIKAVEVGVGVRAGTLPGRQAHDSFVVDDHGPHRSSNRAGGLEGGMSTGEELRLVATMKPFSTIPGGLPSFDIGTGVADRGLVERSDVCAVPAAAVVAEAMVCLTLADALLTDLGGDSMGQLLEHLAGRRARAAAMMRGDAR